MTKLDRLRKTIEEKAQVINIKQLYEEAPNKYVLTTYSLTGDGGLNELGFTITGCHDSRTQELRPAIEVHFTDKEDAKPYPGFERHSKYSICGACHKPIEMKPVEGGPFYGFRFYNPEDGSVHYCPKWNLNAENNKELV